MCVCVHPSSVFQILQRLYLNSIFPPYFKIHPIEVGLAISLTNWDSQCSPVYTAFYRIGFCGNEPIGR